MLCTQGEHALSFPGFAPPMLIWPIARRLRPPQSAGRALPRRQLYGPELRTLADYFERCERLRATLAPHVVGLLRAGVSVVLDFHANTLRSRRWMRALFEEAGASHQLHFLDVPDEVCRARMHARKAAGGDGVSDAEFDHVTSLFVPPEPGEAFNVIRYGEE